MIISEVTHNSMFVGIDMVQAKMLTEVLRRIAPSSCKEAAAAVAKDGFDYVSEADVHAMASSAAFALGRLTDQFVAFKKAEAINMIAELEANRNKEGKDVVN